MPTYEYKCPKCGIFETEQKITAPALEECPACNSEVKRLISRNVGIVFKGSGFYCTDNRKSEPASSGAACPEAAAASTGGGACAACPNKKD